MCVSNYPQIRHKLPTHVPQIFWSHFYTKPVLGGPNEICGQTFCWPLGNLWAAPGTHLWGHLVHLVVRISRTHRPHTAFCNLASQTLSKHNVTLLLSVTLHRKCAPCIQRVAVAQNKITKLYKTKLQNHQFGMHVAGLQESRGDI